MTTHALFTGLGVPVGPAAAPFSGASPSASIFLRDEIPDSMKGDVWSCLIAGLAVGEQFAWDNAPLVANQMFLATASSIWLNRRAAGLGLERPVGVGMLDEAFRQYSIQSSSRQLTIPAFLEMLRVFYGQEAVQANLVSADQTYILVNGQTLVITFDNLTTVTVTFHTADFVTIGAATAVEVAAVLNREFLSRGINALALVGLTPTTRVNHVVLLTGTLGARGSVLVASGAAQVALGLATTLSRLLGQSRASYVLTRGKGLVEVLLPATSVVVARNDTSAAYVTINNVTPGVGPYLYEEVDKGLAITAAASTTAGIPLVGGNQYRLVEVASSTLFPDVEGWVVFGYGNDFQAGPVVYLGKAGPAHILVDPTFTFPETIPLGSYVNLLVNEKPPVPVAGEIGDFILTDSPAGRVAAAEAIDSISAAGYTVTKTIVYPGDVGVGNAGHPTHGTQALSDIVQCFAGSGVDAEVAAAREV